MQDAKKRASRSLANTAARGALRWMSPANFIVASPARGARLVSGRANGVARERRAPAERPKGWEDESRWRPRGGNSRGSTASALSARSRDDRGEVDNQNEGRHVDLALYARMWGRRLSERRSHSDGARRAASAPIAKSNMAGPERRAAPGRPPLFCARSPFVSRQCLRVAPPRRGDCPLAQIIVS